MKWEASFDDFAFTTVLVDVYHLYCETRRLSDPNSRPSFQSLMNELAFDLFVSIRPEFPELQL